MAIADNFERRNACHLMQASGDKKSDQADSYVRRSSFSACEIERRPRGASRRKAAPTFVATCQTCQVMVARLAGVTIPPGWRGCRTTCLKSCAKGDSHGLTGMAKLQQMWERPCVAKRRAGGDRSHRR